MGYRRSKEDKRRLKKLYDETNRYTFCGAWFDDKKNRYIKVTASNTPGYTKYLRRISNRKIRRQKEAINYGQYKKYFDYRWVLY